MSWNYDKSLKRIRTHLDNMGEITVEKLKREANLEELLSETNCREIFGGHVYVDVTNFSSLASAATANKEDIKRLAQAVHVYQREIARIIEMDDMFDGIRVHFQGSRVHALFYRPIDDTGEISARALLLLLVVQDFVQDVFNPAFPKLGNFKVAGGADIGDVVGTKNGIQGDRELLFVGCPANHAAKILSATGSLRVTDRVFQALPEDLQALCIDAGDDVHEIDEVDQSTLDELCETYDIAWSRDKSADRLEDDRKLFPLSGIEIEDADTLIDIEVLSVHKNKRVPAASVFADLSGFTAYIDQAEDADKQKEALRVLHAVRKEFTKVLTDDYNGVRIQYQGDRTQAIFHLPKDDSGAISSKALHAAVGVQSSMEKSLKELLHEAKVLSVAIGIDIGQTFVSRLGTRGARDAICLGEAVETAAKIEERINGQEIGVSTNLYELLPEEYQELFAWRREAQCYVVSGLTIEKLERIDEAKNTYSGSRSVYIKSAAGVTTVSSSVSNDARAVVPAKSYAE